MCQTYRIFALTLACCFAFSCSACSADFKEKEVFDPRHSLYPIVGNANSFRAFYGQRGFVQGNSLLVRLEVVDPKQFIKKNFNLKLEDFNSKDPQIMEISLKAHYKLNDYLRENGQSWIPVSFVPHALYFAEFSQDSLSFILGEAGKRGGEPIYYIFFEK